MLQAKQAGRRFRRGTRTVCAVRGASLDLSAGQIAAITGPSGSGKTTLLHMLAGLLPPTEGDVLLDNQNLYQMNDIELSRLRGQRISLIPQGPSALQSLTVLENVLLPHALHPTGENRTERGMALLDRMGIGQLAAARPDSLSGGELRRMAVARAMISCPEVILADEPTSNLDDENTIVVMTALQEEAERGAAVLFVTHELDTLSFANAIYRMSNGILSDAEQPTLQS